MAYADNSQMILDQGRQRHRDRWPIWRARSWACSWAPRPIMLLQGEQAELADTFDGGEPVRFENYNVCFTELAGRLDRRDRDRLPRGGGEDSAEYGDDY